MDTPVTIGPFTMPASVLVAIIAAIASVVGAGVTAGVTVWNAYKTDKSSKALEEHKNNLAKDLEGRKKVLTTEMDNHKNELAKDLEAYKDTLTETQAERAARRDYQYEARKRLYQQYEPLLFQLVEHCESAKERIYSLARSAKEGDLEKVGWLSKWDDYYLYSTIYFLLSPLVIFKLMQQSVTFVDLTVDMYINEQYLLAKQLAWSFTDAHDFAKIAPKVDYHPDDPKQQREQHPAIYWRQGIPVGVLDKAVEACIKRDSKGVSRCMSYGEFEESYTNPETKLKFGYISTVFLKFHPKTRPVLWRMLITQVHLHEALLSTRQIKLAASDEKSKPKLVVKLFFEKAGGKLDWRRSSDEATDEEVLRQPFKVAHEYLCGENSFVRHLVEK